MYAHYKKLITLYVTRIKSEIVLGTYHRSRTDTDTAIPATTPSNSPITSLESPTTDSGISDMPSGGTFKTTDTLLKSHPAKLLKLT